MFGVKHQMIPVISAGPKNLTSSADRTHCTAVDKQLRDTGGREGGVTEYVKTPNKALLLKDAGRSEGREYMELITSAMDISAISL